MDERRLGPVVGLGTWRTFGGDVRLASEVVGAALVLIDRRDPRSARAAAAGRDHGLHNIARAREQGLDRAVGTVAHPAFEAMVEGCVFSPGAKADALNLAADDHPADDVPHAQPSSPVSLLRAPRQAEGDQRCSERM